MFFVSWTQIKQYENKNYTKKTWNTQTFEQMKKHGNGFQFPFDSVIIVELGLLPGEKLTSTNWHHQPISTEKNTIKMSYAYLFKYIIIGDTGNIYMLCFRNCIELLKMQNEVVFHVMRRRKIHIDSKWLTKQLFSIIFTRFIYTVLYQRDGYLGFI